MRCFTQLCILCGYPSSHTSAICEDCEQSLPILPRHCQQCARFLTATSTLTCGACLKNPPAFTVTHALFPYKPPINRLIAKLKFQGELCYAKTLGKRMAKQIQTSWYLDQPLPDLIIPIPLHFKRVRERGFNQAVEIAKPIAKALSIPIDYHGVTRNKKTIAQSGLSAHLRKNNITGAFSSSQNYQGLTIALVDDVMTTGHTVMECAHLLNKKGATRIDVWCAARNG